MKEKPLPPELLKPIQPAPARPKGDGIHLGGDCYWDPMTLPNPHVVVIGASGSGKTQTLKALAYEIPRRYPNCQIVIVDFHGDQEIPGETCYPLHMSSPYGINPLLVNLDPSGGGPALQAIQVAHSLRKLQIGANQEGMLIRIFKRIYADRGITQEQPESWTNKPPNFRDLEKELESLSEDNDDKEAAKLLIKLAATFQYGIFSRPQIPLEAPVIRIDLSKLPPALQSISAESLANQMMNQHRLYGESQLRTVLFVDEAKEMRGSNALDRVIADGRKYGLGLVLASQSERHLSKDVIGNSATKIVLPVDQTEVKSVAKKFRFAEERIAALTPFKALVRLGKEAEVTEIYPYYKRIENNAA